MFEALIITLLVLWSAVVVFKKVLPKTSSKLQFKLAQLCQQRGWQALAKWLQPKAATGCGGSCDCSQSDQESSKTQVQAVKWK